MLTGDDLGPSLEPESVSTLIAESGSADLVAPAHEPGPSSSEAPPREANGARGQGNRAGAASDDLAGLRPALDLLDRCLRGALAEAERRFGAEAAADPYRGLYLSPEDVTRSLEADVGAPAFPPSLPEAAARLGAASPRLTLLSSKLRLSPFEVSVVLVALAPEVDLRYERIYALLQDDVTRRRPSVDLALSLLCGSTAEKLERRRHFGAQSPLLDSGLLELVTDPARPATPLLSRELVLCGGAIAYLLGVEEPDFRLAPILLPRPPLDAASSLPVRSRRRVAEVVRRAREAGRPLRLYFQGPAGSGRLATAFELAGIERARLLVLDPAHAPVDEATLDRLVAGALLEARLRGWPVYIAGFDAGTARWGEAVTSRLLGALSRHPGLVILAGSREWWAPPGALRDVVAVPFPVAPLRRRRAAWRRALSNHASGLPPSVAESLAGRFELNPLQIAGAAKTAHESGGSDASPFVRPADALFSAARAQAGRDLGEHAQRVLPVFDFDDLVLPADGKRQLREICQRVEHRQRVMDDWGFGARLPLGSGVNALFSGPSGTGKTMAAQVVAAALGLDLYRIDLSRIVSKYIGETEKNLGRIFDQAESSNAILFFDEADALFGKRSEVKDAHDRYANIEIGYLLQKMEEYRGVTILATNLRRNMDDAFVRRLAFHVQFPFPEEDDRVRIWERVLPADMPLADDVDLGFLGRRFRVTGGNIRNVALAGAFLAAEDDTALSMRHLVLGMRREFQKIGKVCVEADFEPYFDLLTEPDPEETA